MLIERSPRPERFSRYVFRETEHWSENSLAAFLTTEDAAFRIAGWWGAPGGGRSAEEIKAIEVAGYLLDHLASAQTPVALRELAAAGHMSPGKVHRYLASFLASGLARQDPDTRRYALGPLAMRLGLAALNSYQPLRDAIELQRAVRNQLDETLVLSVWGAQGPTVVHVEESSQPIIMTMKVGAVLPMLATATGLVFAAFLPRAFH